MSYKKFLLTTVAITMCLSSGAIAHRWYETNWITSEMIQDESGVVVYCEYRKKPSGISIHELRRQLASVGNIARESRPDVAGKATIVFENTTLFVVDGFENGFEGQIITVVGDGFTTIADNANFVLNQVGALLLLADNVYQFIFVAGEWVQL